MNLLVNNFDLMVSCNSSYMFHNFHLFSDSFDCSEKVTNVDDALADRLSLPFHDLTVMTEMLSSTKIFKTILY